MSKARYRLKKVLKAIDAIEFILHDADFHITKAVEDAVLKPAIRMHIIRISEEFNKLKMENEFRILENFSLHDLKGLNAVRNFIAHDYDSVDDEIIENVVRYNIPSLKQHVQEVLNRLDDNAMS